GGTSGSGVILLSLLMAAGLEGAAVIATDAVISIATSVIKISVFGLAGVVTPQVVAFALLIGAIALPGAFLAKAFVERMPLHIHAAILDAAVITGGAVMSFSPLGGACPTTTKPPSFRGDAKASNPGSRDSGFTLRVPRNDGIYGHFTSGGIDDRIESTLPPVFRPNVVPRS